ncbi:MAG: hypothetical protein KJS90_02380 [Acidobacteria bacterium]|nr:hypothetical protein [Acidobacteriota bacterium]
MGGDHGRRLTVVLLWFVGVSWFAVWNVFRDPRFPFAAVAAGAVLPDAVGLVVGRAAPSHSAVVVSVAMLAAVAATVGRRSLRKVLIAGAIGSLLHIVFDFSAGDAGVFWWPVSGVPLPDRPIPSLDRPLAVNVVLEVVGVLLIGWVSSQRRAARAGG